jgi:hypothetical protein
MTIGSNPTSQQLNTDLIALVVRVRDDCRDISDLAQQVAKAGGLTALESAGFTAPEATAYQQVLDYLSTIAGIFHGTATQGTTFNFEDATAGFVLGT